jgi:hypothetical protein
MKPMKNDSCWTAIMNSLWMADPGSNGHEPFRAAAVTLNVVQS